MSSHAHTADAVRIQRWTTANAGKRELVEMAHERNSMMFPDDDPIQKFGMRITMRAGSMVIWDQRTPHGGSSSSLSSHHRF
jgi:hypothetical protein